MKKIYLFTMVLLSLAVIQFSGCVSNNEEAIDETENLKEIDEISENLGHEMDAFRLPSPIELFIYLKENNTIYQKDELSIENEFYTTKSKALNFGVYASDLAYSSVFSENQKTFTYYKYVKTLADDLGLTDGFDEEISKRVKDNINNTDSLYAITNDAYWDACSFLEAEGKQDVLSYVTVGGWLESLYIALKSVGEFSENNKVVLRIADQGLLLENLLAHLDQKHKGDEEMADIINKLTDLQITYDAVAANTDVLITKVQFDEILAKVTAIRKSMIN